MQGRFDTSWDMEEVGIGLDVNDGDIQEEDATRLVELAKAIRMMWCNRYATHCDACEPLYVPSPRSAISCRCTVHSHFVRPWRCIPCVLAEEASLTASQQKYTIQYNPLKHQKALDVQEGIGNFMFSLAGIHSLTRQL